MKKFSKIYKVEVAEEPKPVKVEKSTKDELSEQVQYLMDQFLTIQTYGPIDRYQRAGTIKIKGKELFLEALMKLLSSNKDKDTISVLESLKMDISDWKTIDDKIESIKESKYDLIKESELLKNKEGVFKSLSKYEHDAELCIISIKESVSKTNNKELLNNRYLSCLELKKENKFPLFIDDVINIYINRIKEL